MNDPHDEQCALHYGGECDCGSSKVRPVDPVEGSVAALEEDRFLAWYAGWRGVFANEIQARTVFKEAQPLNT